MAIRQISTISDLSLLLDADRAAGRRIGLVPTMGALHAGHASLITQAAARTDVVVTTVFVNPLQFAPTEDLSAYPRDLESDMQLAEAAGAHLIFTPSVEEMYPFGPSNVLTNVSVSALTTGLDGAARPGHFDGVATVVAKLFAIVGRCSAFFGEKDFQQLAVVRRMATDLSFPVDVIGCQTVREADGLAMSSRNRYLTADERRHAPLLNQALRVGGELFESGERSADVVREAMRNLVAADPLFGLQYAEAVDPLTLEPLTLTTSGQSVRLVIAATLGRARLIDNIGAVCGSTTGSGE
jgi:pantoate--beta-alanine ligase